jgi:Ca-activated chloride channel family protein
VLYASLLNAYELAGRAQRNAPDVVTSIVVMTDAHSTSGATYRQFTRLLSEQTREVRSIPTYSLLFGDPVSSPFGDPIPNELQDLAERTGGRVFDAREADLSAVAKEIRGYE